MDNMKNLTLTAQQYLVACLGELVCLTLGLLASRLKQKLYRMNFN